MRVSLCMGTVKFEAKAGTITDLGEILTAYDDVPTTIPELVHVVKAKPSGTNGGYTYAVAIRPADAATAVPAPLSTLPRVAADYHAMGFFPNFTGAWLGRLAPLPGVLAYDKNGDVMDLKATPAAGALAAGRTAQ